MKKNLWVGLLIWGLITGSYQRALAQVTTPNEGFIEVTSNCGEGNGDTSLIVRSSVPSVEGQGVWKTVMDVTTGKKVLWSFASGSDLGTGIIPGVNFYFTGIRRGDGYEERLPMVADGRKYIVQAYQGVASEGMPALGRLLISKEFSMNCGVPTPTPVTGNDDEAYLFLNQSSSTTNTVGEYLYLDLGVAANAQPVGVDLSLIFNPDVLQLMEVQSTGGLNDRFQFNFNQGNAIVDNTNGTVKVTLSRKQYVTPPPFPVGWYKQPLLRLGFKVAKSGTGTVSYMCQNGSVVETNVISVNGIDMVNCARSINFSQLLVANLTPTPKIVGDANGDGKVNLVDFDIWKRELRIRAEGPTALADFDKNGLVNLLDFMIWKQVYLSYK